MSTCHLIPSTEMRLARMWYLGVLQQPVGVEAPFKGGFFRVERGGKNGMSSLAAVEAEKSIPSSETQVAFPQEQLDDGRPESAEEQVTLAFLEVVHKRTAVNVLILIQLMNRKEMR